MPISPEIVNQLKQQYEDIYSVHIGKQDFLFRALTVEEHNTFTRLDESSADLEELVVMNAVVYPHPIDINKMRAGDVTSLSNEILEISGFVGVDTVKLYLDQARYNVSMAIPAMYAFIIAAMPTYTSEILNTYTLKQITNLVAEAEMILEIQSSISRGESVTLNLTSAEEETTQGTEAKPKVRLADINLEDLEMVRSDPDAPSKVGTATMDDPIAQRLHAALRR